MHEWGKLASRHSCNRAIGQGAKPLVSEAAGFIPRVLIISGVPPASRSGFTGGGAF